MRRRNAVLCCAIPILTALSWGCSSKPPLADQENELDLSSLSVPLDLSEFDVVTADGDRRGVFLKLTRLPDSVTHRDESDPARIVLDIRGPTGEVSDEQVYPGGDSLVSRMRVLRTPGILRVILDLRGDDPPDYSVHTMADWVMIRIRGGTS